MKNSLFRNLPPPNKDYTQPTRSTVMFQGNFRDELQKTIDLMEQTIEEYKEDAFEIDSVMAGGHNLKIRLTENEHNTEMIINCVFRYHHKDEKYGYVDIDLTTSGFWRKSEYYYVGKFSILDRDTIQERILAEIIECMKEIY